MKRLLLCLLLWAATLAAMAAVTPVTPRIDSLLRKADSLPPGTERLQLLRKVVRATQMNPEGTAYTRRLLREAEALHHDSLTAYSIAFLTNHLFAEERNMDSLRHWTHYGLAVAKRCNYWHMYFQMQKTMVQTYLYADHYEYAIREARKMLEEARRIDHVDGQLIAHSCLATAYESAKQWKECYETLMEAYRLFDRHPQTANKVTILKQLLYYLNNAARFEEMPPFLDCMQQELDSLEHHFPAMAPALNDYRLMLACYSIQYHAHGEEKAQAEEHIRQAKRYVKLLNYEPYYIIYANALATYYTLCKQYDKALAMSDTALARVGRKGTKSSRYAYYLEQRAAIYYDMQRYDLALPLYREARTVLDSLSRVISRTQVEEINDLYRIDELEMAQEEQEQKFLWMVVLVVSLLLVVTLYYVIRRNHLKRAWIASEQERRKTMLATEAANEAKHRFLETMSHAIRVPLHSVVGFSQLLATGEEMSEDERTEYAGLIQRDTEKLLFLVNSILDLSRLEAGMTKWQLSDCDPVRLFDDAMRSAMQHHSLLHVVLEAPATECTAHTDPMRLADLFKSLVEGVVTTPITETREVKCRLVVTDGQLQGTVQGSPLADAACRNQETNLRHQINRLTLMHFGGSYAVDEKQGLLRFHLPLSAAPHS